MTDITKDLTPPDFLRRPRPDRRAIDAILRNIENQRRWSRSKPRRPEGQRWQSAQLRDVFLQDEAPTIGCGRRLVWVSEGRRYCKLASIDGVSKAKITMATWAIVVRASQRMALPGNTPGNGETEMTKKPTTTAEKPAKAKVAKPKPTPAQPAASTESGSKQDRLIAMMRQPGGVTVEDAAKALDWQAHTVRGAIAGALKKKLGLNVVSERAEGSRKTTYRIAG